MSSQTPRNKKWVDGREGYMWPIDAMVGWTVQTAGLVNLDDIRPLSGRYNYGPVRRLPSKTKVLLKHIDDQGRAYVYSDNGVMMMPKELLEPVGK